jgi:hypothetical protein
MSPSSVLALLVSFSLALLPHDASPQRSEQAATNFPLHGVLIGGQSLAGVRLGYTQARVKSIWGSRYKVCDRSFCPNPTWLYQYSTGEALGAAVVFEHGKVTAVFTLGSPDGWRTNKGLKMGDVISQVYDYYDTSITTKCIGYDAISYRTGSVTTSFYSSSGYVYGFALTAPSQPICQ